jgi:hypothetical protein
MDFKYYITNNQVTIRKYTGNETDIIIPNEIQNLPVTTIGLYAFHCKGLTSVILPQHLITICRRAFYSNKLTNIILPQNLVTIEEEAFSHNELTSITLSQNITTIGQYAFNRNKLTSISISDELKTEKQLQRIFGFGLNKFGKKNRAFIKPYLAEILGDNIHHHFHDIIASYTTPSNELIQEAIEAIEA